MLLFAGLIAVVAVAHLKLGLDAILAFWIAYVLTRPLGASIGDLLSQPHHIPDGADPAAFQAGLGLGATVTSLIFLAAIVAVIVYMTSLERSRLTSTPSDAAAT